MRYSLKAILEKEPAVIASAVRTLLWVFVLVGLLTLDEKVLAGIAVAMEAVLLLFVRSTSTPLSNPTLAADTVVKVAGTGDTVTIQPSPPGPTGEEGDLP